MHLVDVNGDLNDMDAIRSVYKASQLVETIRMQLGRKDLDRQQKDAVVTAALDLMDKLFAEVKATNPVPEPGMSVVDKLILEKLGHGALKPPTDGADAGGGEPTPKA